MMRFIPTVIHGVLDYLVGLMVIGLPFAVGIHGPALIALVASGSFAIIYSLFTDYELGAIRLLRVRFHLALDVVFGVAMLSIPTAFDIPPAIQWPVYVIGLVAIVLSTITKIRPTGTAS